MKIIVTGGAIIQDEKGRILFQRRSDYGTLGLPGGGMEAGESIEETMKREVSEETGLEVTNHELYAIYSGERMNYRYPDGNEVTFVMFVFKAHVKLEGKLDEDQSTITFKDHNKESLLLQFMNLEEVPIDEVSHVQRPLIEDLKSNKTEMLRT